MVSLFFAVTQFPQKNLLCRLCFHLLVVRKLLLLFHVPVPESADSEERLQTGDEAGRHRPAASVHVLCPHCGWGEPVDRRRQASYLGSFSCIHRMLWMQNEFTEVSPLLICHVRSAVTGCGFILMATLTVMTSGWMPTLPTSTLQAGVRAQGTNCTPPKVRGHTCSYTK